MGTPEFATCSLEQLCKSGHDVVAVVTVADKPAGRGQVVQQSHVKKFAVDHSIPVLQPLRLKDEEFLSELKSFQADLFVVVAFRMLPDVVWQMPPLGTINLHGSLLPDYRGAAPINHVIINGEKQTGVTTFFLQHEIDTGNIILREKMDIGENETAGELHDRMKIIGAGVLDRTIDLIALRKAEAVAQSDLAKGTLHEAPKLSRERSKIDWNQSVHRIHNHVRGLSPYPAAWTVFNDKTLKIFSGNKTISNHPRTPGSYETDGKSSLRFACSDGWYEITELQLEGKKRMTVVEFLNGVRISTA